jgi:hypothetical protein
MRGGDERIACRMQSRFAATTSSECEYVRGSARVRLPQTFFRDSFAGVFVGARKGDLQRLFALGGPQTTRAILAQTVHDTATRETAVRLVDRQVRARQLLTLRYTRGDISEPEFTRQLAEGFQRDSRELRAVLGPELHAAYKQRTDQYYREEVRKALGE